MRHRQLWRAGLPASREERKTVGLEIDPPGKERPVKKAGFGDPALQGRARDHS